MRVSSMLTDWVLIARAAHELDQRFAGARVLDAGTLPDGRLALSLRSRGGTSSLAFDVFGSPPIVTVEDADLAIAAEPGFVRKMATTLRGMQVARVTSRRGDRLLRIELQSRSRFGVGDALELYVELVPRFGNVVLVKRGTVVAAAKEFSLAENPARAIGAGLPYALPPLPQPLPKPREPGAVADDASVLDAFAEYRRQRVRSSTTEGVARRRHALLRRLDQRHRKLQAERGALADKRRAVAAREELRAEGEAIFATLHELAEDERADAKDRAAKLFARYKKLTASIPHLDERERALAASIEGVEALRWEAERASDEDVADVESAVAALEPARSAGRTPAKVNRRKRAPLEFRTPAGSRIVVGRSPSENADVTFRVARPDDLWFHAQGIPGAHVVLARDDRTPPPDEDIELAAALAAFHSKARAGGKVPVDYTLRKYVRKQQKAPPGLVWYTQPTTVLVRPASGPSS
ncbi:MAG: DUF814 domain-containing protein [Candidatus Eremiobacteraeota bacterium]|nr:DUF814 domain-containing protein [Candidatus Eremiobacteraeota bacterium]